LPKRPRESARPDEATIATALIVVFPDTEFKSIPATMRRARSREAAPLRRIVIQVASESLVQTLTDRRKLIFHPALSAKKPRR